MASGGRRLFAVVLALVVGHAMALSRRLAGLRQSGVADRLFRIFACAKRERRILHARALENVLLHVIVIALATHALDDQAKNEVAAVGISLLSAGRKEQGITREKWQVVAQRANLVFRCRAKFIAKEVSDARTHVEQLFDRHLLADRLIRIVGQVDSDLVGELDLALLRKLRNRDLGE